MAFNKAVAIFGIWFVCSMLLAIAAAARTPAPSPAPAPATQIPSVPTPTPAPTPSTSAAIHLASSPSALSELIGAALSFLVLKEVA
ncbi:hypothetical protein SLE2022_192920 [Rubroshorea leprosula]